MFGNLPLIQKIVIWAIPVIFAITVHEVAHGWVASKLGDNTAKMLGRLTLNPMKHIDPIGTLLIPGLLLAFGGFIFGWAKPVPISSRHFKNPRRDMAIVAIAGPAANFLMAVLWAAILKLAVVFLPENHWLALPVIYMGQAGIIINLILMLLNILPIPPLDGSRVLYAILPGRYADTLSRYEQYGFIVVLLLLVTGVLGLILGPAFVFFMQMISSIV